MNRSVERHRFPVAGVRPGEVVVSPFDHPTRGSVRCAAAPLVAGELRRGGWRVREGTVAVAERSAADSVLFAVTYLDRSGDTVGVAVAANATDAAGLAAAADAVETWRAALRTRRLLVAAIDPSCPGARRARRLVHAHPRRPVHVLGHSPALAGVPGTVPVPSLDTVPHAATVVIPPSGAPAGVRAEAGARGLDVIDATCPIVEAARQTAHRFTADGDAVLLVGGQSNVDGVTTVESTRDVTRLRLDPERVAYVVGGCTHAEHATHLTEALRARYPRVRAQHPDGLCYASADRAETIRSVCDASDMVLVLGDTPATMVAGTRTRHINAADDIRLDWFIGAGTIGLVNTAEPARGHAVIQALSDLGPLSVAHRRVTTEIVKDRGGPADRPNRT